MVLRPTSLEPATVVRFGSCVAWTALTVRGMSEQVSPALPPASDQRVPMVRSAWVPIGWVCAFVFPLGGFVIGFFLPRKHSQQGLWMMAVSVVGGVIFLANYPR